MLRIISGTNKRKRLRTPPGTDTTRPIPDRVREAMFNLLRGHFEGQTVLDVFAGSGSFGLEAHSRGASRVVMIENDRKVAAILRENVEMLDADDACEVIEADALGPLALGRAPKPVHIVFFDPPYPLVIDPARREFVWRQFARAIDLLDETGYAIMRTPWPYADLVPREHDPDYNDRVPISLDVENALGPETHEYGSTAIHLYMKKQGVENQG